MTARSTRRRQDQNVAADEAAIRALPQRMIDAWNAGDGTAFAASFSDTAGFVAFEGTHLDGRHAITEFHFADAFESLLPAEQRAIKDRVPSLHAAQT
jgi:uncharacterized protein (TIGR02246 family)